LFRTSACLIKLTTCEAEGKKKKGVVRLGGPGMAELPGKSDLSRTQSWGASKNFKIGPHDSSGGTQKEKETSECRVKPS